MAMRRSGRQAFTLIELLVAMALTVFVMSILSEAFVKGLETFSGLKAIGDMQENLRVATNNLRGDLDQDHFNGKRRVSDPHLWTDRPRNGFFAIYHGSAISTTAGAPYYREGQPEGIPSDRARDHILHMTVKRKGNRMEDFFSAPMPVTPDPQFATLKTNIYGAPADATRSDPSTFKSQWAEVAYFLVRTGTTVNGADSANRGGGVPVHNLYRLELLIVPDNEAVNAAAYPYTHAVFNPFSHFNRGDGTAYFPSPGDVVDPNKRGFKPALAASYVPRASLVMSDVISFQVQALHHTPPNPSYWGDVQGGVFDTGAAGYPAQIKGVSITIRAWDRDNAQARQTTIMQDL